MISEETFKTELDQHLKDSGYKKAERDKIVRTAFVLIPPHEYDEHLEMQAKLAREHLANKKASKSVESEKSAQQRVVEWFRTTYPDEDIYMNRNDGFRKASEKAEQITLGLLRGVPDLMIPDAFCYVEMKKEKGGVISKEQEEFAKKRDNAGYTVLFCFGFDDAVKKISEVMECYFLVLK